MTRKPRRNAAPRRLSGAAKAIWPALVAVGGGIAASPAAAIELGPLEVHSKLGHPLRASIAFALGPNETIAANCVSLRSGTSDLPAVFGARVSIANGVIALSGSRPINEPLMSANLVIDCPYTAHVSRSLTVFLDPSAEPAAVTASAPAVTASVSEPRPVPRRPVRSQPQAATATPIAPDSSYLVQPGDSLSEIAQRLQGRTIALQPAMTMIYDANPEAFEEGDPNLLRAGSLLAIPSLAGTQVAARPAISEFVPSPVTETPEISEDAANESGSLYSRAESQSSFEVNESEKSDPVDQFVTPQVQEPVETVADSPAPTEADTVAEAVAVTEEMPEVSETASQESDAAFADLLPGDVVVDERPVVNESADAAAADPVAPPPRQIAGSRIIATPPSQESLFSNWLVWLTAGVLAVIGAWVAFGQRIRERFGSTPIGPGEVTARPQSEHGSLRVAAITVPEPTMSVEEIQPSYDAVDFDLSDDSPTEENLALDADLIDGTGFEDSGDVAVNEDFGFAATTSLDMELSDLPDEPEDTPQTDIIPPPERLSDDMVIDSEVLPDDEDYDMSVIVDVTKMPNPNDVTERDLMAVPVDDDNGQNLISDAYTINDEVHTMEDMGLDDEIEVAVDDDPMGTRIDDELAATQALSEEIEKAAAELASSSDPSGETSIEMQLTNLSDLDLTSELEAQNDDYDNDVTSRLEANDETVEMPAKDKNAS
jgi:hypothetical protein